MTVTINGITFEGTPEECMKLVGGKLKAKSASVGRYDFPIGPTALERFRAAVKAASDADKAVGDHAKYQELATALGSSASAISVASRTGTASEKTAAAINARYGAEPKLIKKTV